MRGGKKTLRDVTDKTDGNPFQEHEHFTRFVYHLCLHTADSMISVVMPVFNTPREYLREAVDSILKQTYLVNYISILSQTRHRN